LCPEGRLRKKSSRKRSCRSSTSAPPQSDSEPSQAANDWQARKDPNPGVSEKGFTRPRGAASSRRASHRGSKDPKSGYLSGRVERCGTFHAENSVPNAGVSEEVHGTTPARVSELSSVFEISASVDREPEC